MKTAEKDHVTLIKCYNPTFSKDNGPHVWTVKSLRNTS